MGEELKRLTALVNNTEKKVNNDNIITSVGLNPNGLKQEKKDEENGQLQSLINAHRPSIEGKGEKRKIDELKEEGTEDDDSVFLPNDRNKEEGDKSRNKRNRPTEPKPVDWDLVDPKTGKNGENKSNTDHNTMMSYHAHGQRFGDHAGGQQHEVFAFSTYLANRAAQTVLGGTSNSIISYHQTQSASRKFLQADQDAQDKTPPSSADSGVAHTSSNNSPEDQSSSRQGTPIPLGTPDPKTQDNLQKPMDGIEPKECRTPKGNNTSSTPEGGNSTPSNSVHNETLTPVSSGHETSTPTPPTTTKKPTGRKRKTSVKGVTKMLQQQQQQQQHHQQHYGPHVNPPFQGHFPSQVGYNMNNPFHPDMPMPFPGNQRISPVGVPQPSTTETEDLSPSALWENPPSKKISGPGAWKPQMDMMPNMQNSMMGHPRMNVSAKMQHRQLMRPTQFQQHSQGSMVSLPFGPAVVNSDENLTPDQLRHRQEKLRQLTDMKRILLHDKPGSQMTPPRMMSPGGGLPQSDMMMMPENPMMQGMMRTGGPGMMEPPQRIMISPTGMGVNPQHMPMMPQDEMMSPDQRMMMQPSMNNDWENATPAQKAWVKLQHEYYQEKQQNKILGKQQNMMNLAGPNMPMDSHDPMGDFGMNPQGMPGAGNVPPPPPYHGPQTPFVGRQTMGGSFPMSGGMPSNNMPLSPTRLMIAQPGNRTNRTGSMPGIQPQMAFQRSQGNMNMPMSPTPNMQSNSGLDTGLTGSMMEQSPRPGHPGTPGMENFGTTRSNSNNMNPMSQPNVPSPQMPKPNTSSANTGIPTPLTSTPEASMPKTSAESIQQMTKASDVQMGQPQRLVNFPPSQLNRDKAPNFPPRGEEQFASHFYQKPMDKKPPGRLQHYNSNMGGGHEMMPSPQGMLSSHGNMMSPQPGMMSSKSGMIALTSPGGQQMGGQSGMMPQQRMNSSQAQMRIMPQDMMTSQTLTTSQSNMMSSHSSMMPSQSATMNSQSDMMTSSQGMMSPMGMMSQQPGFIGNQRTMVSPGNNMAPGMNMPNMGNHGLMGNPGSMPCGMGMSDMGMPNMGMPNEGNMGHGMMSEHGMGTTSIPNDVINMQQQGNTVMRNNNRSMGSSNNQVPLPASLPIDASSRTTPNMTGQKMNSGAAPNTPSSGDSQNPLAILQNRFEPPLLPDGKGPKQTLQYFPTPDAQAQSGNPHLNPGMNPGPVSQPPSQGPKQIQMPFPMDMVRPGMQGMSQGYGPRLSGPRMNHTDAMYQQQMGGMPRNQMTGMYGMSRQMQPDMFVPGPRHRMMNPNMMGQQPMGGFSDPVMGGPQGPGGMMAMNNPMMQYQNMPNM